MKNVPTHGFRLTVIDHYDVHGIPPTLERFYPGVVGSAKETKRKSVYLWAKGRVKLVRLCKRPGDKLAAAHARNRHSIDASSRRRSGSNQVDQRISLGRSSHLGFDADPQIASDCQ